VSWTRSTAAEVTDPKPDPTSTMSRGGSRPTPPTDDGPYEVRTVAHERGAQEHAERLSPDGAERESALVEAGRLYGRDHARARAALADGTHPLCRLKQPTG
jgi:hypothetical protein